jgi:predicted metal-dependent hydrolase
MKINYLDEYINIRVDELEIPIQIKRFSSSRGLKILGKGKNIRVTVPMNLSQGRIAEILRPYFGHIKKLYIEGLAQESQLEDKKKNLDLKVYLEGIIVPLRYLNDERQSPGLLFDEDCLNINLGPEALNYENVYYYLDKLFEVLAKQYLTESFNEMLEFFPLAEKPKLILKKLKTQWGNCKKSESRIVLNSHLIKIPPTLRDYVIFHEISHLIHANHGPGFYQIINSVFPNREELDQELKKWAFVLRDNYIEEYLG